METAATKIVLTAYQQLSPEERGFVREQLELAFPKKEKSKKREEQLPFDEETLYLKLKDSMPYLRP